MTTHVQKEKDLAAEKLEAEVREAEARLEFLQAQAEGRNAKEDMDRISGLAAAKERVKKGISDMKQQSSESYSAARRAAEKQVKTLKADLERLGERYSAWDEARGRRFAARLDEVEAKLKGWKAQADQRRADQGMKSREALANLEEKVALARARAAEARHEKYSAKAQAALDKAALHLDEAYEAASKRSETT